MNNYNKDQMLGTTMHNLDGTAVTHVAPMSDREKANRSHRIERRIHEGAGIE